MLFFIQKGQIQLTSYQVKFFTSSNFAILIFFWFVIFLIFEISTFLSQLKTTNIGSFSQNKIVFNICDNLHQNNSF